MQNARGAGLTTSLDTGWDARGEWIEVIGPCLSHTDLLFVNEDEARILTGLPDLSTAARFFVDHGVSSVVIKTGPRGCLVLDQGTEIHVPAFHIEPVDTTGAGDCFAGAFLAALHRGMNTAEAARFANAAGALSVCALGAVTGLRSFEETLQWTERASNST